MNPMNRPDERSLLGVLDRLIRKDEAARFIEWAITAAAARLAADDGALLAWEPIPLGVYGSELPEMILSSWVFILRSGSVTGAERHPNSHQRMASYRGAGDFQIDDGHGWQSNFLSSDPAAGLDQKWVSIPANTWHQGVTGEQDWVVVSFHTVAEKELIEERPDLADGETTHIRRYLN
jgi:hypothetical protein